MRFVKYIIAVVLITLSMSAFALPDEFVVYSSQIAGIKNTVCRKLFSMYGQEYKANPVFVVKQGVEGVLATEEMVKSKPFSVLCSGSAESVFNNSMYPGHESAHNAMTVVTMVGVVPVAFYTRADSPYNNLVDVIKSMKPLTIGTHITGTKFIAGRVFDGYSVTWVPYKNPTEALPSILDGSLDLYADSGGLEELAKEGGRLKSLGHLNGTTSSSGVDLNGKFVDIAKLKLFIAVTTSSANDQQDIEELGRRLVPIVNSKEFGESMKSSGFTINGRSVKDSNAVVEQFRKELAKVNNAK